MIFFPILTTPPIPQATTHLLDLSKSALNPPDGEEDPVEHDISAQMSDALGSIASSRERSKEIMHKSMSHDVESDDDYSQAEDELQMQMFHAKAKKELKEKHQRRQKMEEIEDKEMKVLEARHRKLAKSKHEPQELVQKAAEKKRMQKMISDPFSSNFSGEVAAKKKEKIVQQQKAVQEKHSKALQKQVKLASDKKAFEVKKAAEKIQDEKDQKSMSAERAMKAKIFAEDAADAAPGSGGLVETAHDDSKPEDQSTSTQVNAPIKLRQRLSIIKAVVRGKEEAKNDIHHLENKYGTKNHSVKKIKKIKNDSVKKLYAHAVKLAQPKTKTAPPKAEMKKAQVIKQISKMNPAEISKMVEDKSTSAQVTAEVNILAAKYEATKVQAVKVMQQEAKKAAEAKKSEEEAKKTEEEAKKAEEAAKAQHAAAKAEEDKESKKHANLVHEYQKTLDKLHHKIRVKVHAKIENQHLVEAKKAMLHKLVVGHHAQEASKPAAKKVLTAMEKKMAALQVQLRAERLARVRAEMKAKELKDETKLLKEALVPPEESSSDWVDEDTKGVGRTEMLAQMRSIAERDEDEDEDDDKIFDADSKY